MTAADRVLSEISKEADAIQRELGSCQGAAAYGQLADVVVLTLSGSENEIDRDNPYMPLVDLIQSLSLVEARKLVSTLGTWPKLPGLSNVDLRPPREYRW
jgi:hypothetical protein